MARVPNHVMKQMTAPEGAQLSEGAMAATARSLTGIAQGVGQVGSVVEGFVEEQQNIQNEGDLSQARLALREGHANLINTIQFDKAKNPADWNREYEEGMAKVEAGITKDTHSPVVRNRLKQDYDQFFGQAKIRLAESAIRENINRTMMSYANEDAQMKTSGNLPGRYELNDRKLRDNLISPEQHKKNELALNAEEKALNEYSKIVSDPKAAKAEAQSNIDKVKSGELPNTLLPEYRDTLHKAQQEISKQEAVDLEDIRAFSEEEGVTPDMMQLHLDQYYPDMSKTEKTRIIKGLSRTGALAPSANDYNDMSLIVNSFAKKVRENGFNTDDERIRMWTEVNKSLDAYPPSNIRSSWQKAMFELSPFKPQGDNDQIPGAKVGSNLNRTLKDRVTDSLIDLMQNSGLGTYHMGGKVDTIRGTENNMSPEAVAQRARDIKVAEERYHLQNIKDANWLDMHKGQLTLPLVEAYIQKRHDEMTALYGRSNRSSDTRNEQPKTTTNQKQPTGSLHRQPASSMHTIPSSGTYFPSR